MYYDHMLADAGTTSLEVWEGEILDQVRFLILDSLLILMYVVILDQDFQFCMIY
jgi:hypothetical protein